MNGRSYSPETWIIFFVFCFVVWLGWKFIQRCLRKKYTITYADGHTVELPQYFPSRECPDRLIEQMDMKKNGVVGCVLSVPIRLSIDLGEYATRGTPHAVYFTFPSAEEARAAALSLGPRGDKKAKDYIDYLSWPGFAYLMGEEPRPSYNMPDYQPDYSDKLENKYRAKAEMYKFKGTFPHRWPVKIFNRGEKCWMELDRVDEDGEIEYRLKVPQIAYNYKLGGDKSVQGKVVPVELAYDDLSEVLRVAKEIIDRYNQNNTDCMILFRYFDHFVDLTDTEYMRTQTYSAIQKWVEKYGDERRLRTKSVIQYEDSENMRVVISYGHCFVETKLRWKRDEWSDHKWYVDREDDV